MYIHTYARPMYRQHLSCPIGTALSFTCTSGYIPGLALCVVVWEHVSEGVSAGAEAGGHSHSGA